MYIKTCTCVCVAMCLAGCSGGGVEMGDVHVQRQASLLSGDVLEVVYTFPGPVIRPPRGGALGQVRLSDEYHTTGPSGPGLALMEARVVLPAGYELDRLEVIPEGESRVGREWLVSLTDDVQRYEIRRRDGGQGDAAVKTFEGDAACLVGEYGRRGASIAVINIFPVRFDGDNGTLAYLTSLRLKIHLRASEGDATGMPYRADPYRPVEAEVDNPETLASYESQAKDAVAGKLCQPGRSVDYVIITNAELAGYEGEHSLAELAAMKASAGLSTEVVTVEQINEAFAGQATPEKIRQFIREAYANWGTDFVLLMGDAAAVPTWQFHANAAEGRCIVSDMYYQCLDGEVAAPVNGLTPEIGTDSDWLAEVYLGRVPVSTAEGMSNWIAKLRAHEAWPADGREPGKVLLIGDNLGLGGDADWAKPQLEQIRLGGVFSGIATQGFDSRGDVTVDVLYDQDRVCPHYEGWEVRDQLNANDYLAVHSLGHGSVDNVLKMVPEQIGELTNSRPFFAYIASCRGGNFTKQCAAGELMGARYGAVGLVAYSGVVINMPGDVHSYSQLLSRYFWDAALADADGMAGVINTASHERSLWAIMYRAQRFVILSSNCLGDPAMTLGLP